MTLYERTLQLLKDRPHTLTFQKIETETEIKIPWLSKFVIGEIKDPSVNKIQKLYEFLAKQPLEIKQ